MATSPAPFVPRPDLLVASFLSAALRAIEPAIGNVKADGKLD
jgi:hypothetical protein